MSDTTTENDQTDKKQKSKLLAWLSFAFSMITAAQALTTLGQSAALSGSIVGLAIATSLAITSLEKKRPGTLIIKLGLAAAFIAIIASIGASNG